MREKYLQFQWFVGHTITYIIILAIPRLSLHNKKKTMHTSMSTGSKHKSDV